MSDNAIEAFPWGAIHRMKKLKHLDMGRNKMRRLLDEGEQKFFRTYVRDPDQRRRHDMKPFSVFECLEVVDFSSNRFSDFPEEVSKLPKLKELNLMNNSIKNIPAAFYQEPGTTQHLKLLILNQNELTELDPKIMYLKKLKTLGLAWNHI